MLLILSSSMIFGYDFDNINDNINDKVKKIEKLTVKEYMLNNYDNLTQKQIAKEFKKNKKDVLSNKNNKLRKDIQIKKDKLNNRDIYHNPLGAVKGRNLIGSDVIISNKLIAVNNYNKQLNDEFTVIMFTGDNNINHSISKYEGYTDNSSYARQNSKYYGSYISSDGYIEFNTTSFSTFVNTIGTRSIDGEGSQTYPVNWYFEQPFDSSQLEVISIDPPGVSVGEIIGLSEGSVTSDSYSALGDGYAVLGDIVGTSHQYQVKCFDLDMEISLQIKAWDSSDVSGTVDESNVFTVQCNEIVTLPSYDGGLPSTVSLTGTQSDTLYMNSYYSDYTYINIEFYDNNQLETLSQSLGNSGANTYFGDELSVSLQTVSNNVELFIEGNDIDYSETFTIYGCNSNDCTSGETFTLNIDQLTSNIPEQTTSFANLNLVGFETQTLNLNNFFTNYDDITVSFPADLSSQSLTASKGGSTQQYSGTELSVQLIPTSSRIDLIVYGEDIDYSETFTVQAENNDGSVSDTFTVTVTEDTGTGGGSGGDLETNTQLYYKLIENTGTIAGDSTPNGNDGTITGPTWTTGIIDNALNFDGVNDYIKFPDNSVENQEEITISAWINADSVSGMHTIATKWTENFLLRINSGDLEFFTFTTSQAGGKFDDFSSTGSWNNIVATYDGSTMRVYVNGVDTGTTFSQTGTLGSGGDDALIGARDVGSGIQDYFNGVIDEVAIFDIALTQDDVDSLYNSGTPTTDQQYPYSTTVTPEVEQITSFANEYEIQGTNTLSFNLNNFYTNYESIEILYDDNTASFPLTVNNDGTNTIETIDQNNMLIEMYSPALSPQRVNLDVTGKDVNSNINSFDIRACDSSTCTQYSNFNIETTTTVQDPPTQTTTFGDLTITGSNSESLDISNYFTDFSTVNIVISDPVNSVSETLSIDRLQTDLTQQIYTTSEYEVRLNNIFGVVTITFENFDFTNEVPITITSENSVGSTTGNTFNVNFISSTEGGNGGNGGNGGGVIDTPEWFPTAPDGQELFWAIAFIGLFLFGIIMVGERTDSSMFTFGTVGSIILFILFSVIGWIPIWILIVLIMILIFYYSNVIRNMLTGRGE